MVYEGNEQLQKLLCSTSKNIGRSSLRNRRVILDLRGKENVMVIGRGVRKKTRNCKKIVLHPYPTPITDPTHLLEVSVFFSCFSEYELILSANFEQHVCYNLL